MLCGEDVTQLIQMQRNEYFFLKKTKFFPPQQHSCLKKKNSKNIDFIYFEGIIAIFVAIAIFPHDFSAMCINIQLKNFLKGYLHIE